MCVFPPFSFKSVLIITAGCPSALPQNVARYRGPNRANYMEASHKDKFQATRHKWTFSNGFQYF